MLGNLLSARCSHGEQDVGPFNTHGLFFAALPNVRRRPKWLAGHAF
jgi:hypothetical protein